MGTPSSTVMIHGLSWSLDDIRDDIEWCRRGSWTKEVYGAGPALVDRYSGTIREYAGQHYDPKHFELREQGWTHDHCVICYWRIEPSEDPAVGVAYRAGNQWLCAECHEQFVRGE